jgi:hypothetical protein
MIFLSHIGFEVTHNLDIGEMKLRQSTLFWVYMIFRFIPYQIYNNYPIKNQKDFLFDTGFS